MIDEFYPSIEPQLVALHRFPNFSIVSVTPADLFVMHRNVSQFISSPAMLST